MKRIGNHNIAKIRSLSLSIGTGFLNLHDDVPVLLNGASLEAKWLAIFTRYIRHTERLDYLHVELFDWKEWSNWEANAWTARVFDCRDQLCHHLYHHVRGIREVHVINKSSVRGYHYLRKADTSRLALLMQQSKLTAAAPQPNKLLPLRESLARIAEEGRGG